jgi:hypothetical protein
MDEERFGTSQIDNKNLIHWKKKTKKKDNFLSAMEEQAAKEAEQAEKEAEPEEVAIFRTEIRKLPEKQVLAFSFFLFLFSRFFLCSLLKGA